MDKEEQYCCSMTDLINENPKYSELKEKLQDYVKGSDTYFLELFRLLPLNSWPKYTQFIKQQAIPIDKSSNDDMLSDTFRSVLSEYKLISGIDNDKFPSLYHHFLFRVRNSPGNDCLGYRPFDEKTKTWKPSYEWDSYLQVFDRSKNIGSGILLLVNSARNKPLITNDFIVAILSNNRPEWIISDLACQAYSLPNTALYETLGSDTSEYIMNLTESPVLIFAKSNMFKIMSILSNLKFINTLICIDELNENELNLINNSLLKNKKNLNNESIKLFTLKQVEIIGSLNQIDIIPPNEKSLYTISFTSGTTGLPKGVEMTHRNILSGIAFTFSTFKIPNHKIGKQLHDLCFLPLAHIYQREINAYSLSLGSGIAFLHKPDPTILVEDLKILKPDSLCLVPRVLTKFEAGIKQSLSASSTSSIATNILETKQNRFTTHGGTDKSVLNYLVFHRVLIDKISESLGLSNTTYLITGSAPISTDTLLFLRSALDIGLRQGYGLTETFGGFSISEPHERDPGTCGATGISAECRLRSVPAMNYFVKDLKGEIQVRGPQVFKKYFKNEKDTSKALDENGWFSTGDIGNIDSKGRLSVIDRVKNFFKLAQGEYVAPEKIENIYLSGCNYLVQVFVYGDSLKTYLVGILGIDPDTIKILLNKKIPNIKNMEDQVLIKLLNDDINIKILLLKQINKDAKGLQGFEKLHNIFIDVEPLKLIDDLVTPTLKIKRLNATKHFKPIFDKLYEEGSLIKNEKM